MENVVENVVIDDILNLEREQRNVFAYINELESRRNQLLSLLGTIPEEMLSARTKVALSTKLAKMALVVSVSKPEETQTSRTTTKQKRCRHNNQGFCKMGAGCAYYHADKVCDSFLMHGKCSEPKFCQNRHPKECKFWLGDIQGCLRGQVCKYVHKTENKGKKLQAHVQKEHDDDQFLSKPKQTDSNNVVKNVNTDKEITSETKEVELEKKNTANISSTEEEEFVDCDDTSECVNCIMKHVMEDHDDVTVATCKKCAVSHSSDCKKSK